jgi:alpha-galactosidase
VLRNLDDDAKHPEAAGPGHWNDPDYLAPQLGMTSAEYHAQFSMWSMVAAPLIIGSDVRSLSADTVGMLTNPEVLAIDQDKLGVQGTAIATVGDTQVWSKPLANGDRAVALFNRGTTPAVISTSAAQLGLRAALGYQLRDVWAHTSTETASKVSAAVPAHSVVLLRISTTRDLLGTPPSVTLSPVLIPPTYPGAPVDLAVPGQPLSASATFTNNARTPVADASLTLVVPAGWTLTPSGVSKAGLLATGQTITENWLVTPAPGTLPGSQDLSALASYRWYGLNTTTGPGLISHQVTTRSSTTVQVPSAPPSGNAVLSDQAWLRGTSGYLVPRLDQEVAGGGLVMLGKSYAKGIGTASPSTIDYYLGGNCTNLSATVGIDDSADFDPTGGTAVFQVYGDGVKLYDSGLVTRTATRAVSVALGQAKVLSLVVGNGGDGGYNDRADWAGLQLSCGAPVTTVPAGPWPMFVNPAAQTATTSSSQVGYPASNAVDGQLSTLWHSQFSPVHDPLPISLTVDLESAQTITGLTYQPRLDGTTTGIITGYTIATSQDGVSFTQAAPDGTWGQDSSLKSVALKAVTARYVRLTATSAVNGYASAAEIAVAVQPAQ